MGKIHLNLFLAILISLSGVVYAQTVNSVNWDPSTYYQGDNGILTVYLSNSHPYQICTKEFYIQFDWQKAQNIIYSSSQTPCIATEQAYQFTIPFSVPSNVAVGTHTYDLVWVDNGVLLGTVKNSGSLYVHDTYEKVYLSLVSPIQQSISYAQNSNYRSPTAISNLNQAVSYYNQAITLANSGQYQAAVTDLNQAQTYISTASAAEQSYKPPLVGGSSSGDTSSSDGSMMIFIVLIVALVVVVIYYYNTRTTKKKK